MTDNPVKRQDKEKLVDDLIDMYAGKAEECNWNQNDAFDVACWFLGDMVMTIAEDKLIPLYELRKRVKKKTADWLDEVFSQIEAALYDNT
mgnify:CR=1 FL=1